MKKLKIDELKVKSFITELDSSLEVDTVKGGKPGFLSIGKECTQGGCKHGNSYGIFCKKPITDSGHLQAFMTEQNLFSS